MRKSLLIVIIAICFISGCSINKGNTTKTESGFDVPIVEVKNDEKGYKKIIHKDGKIYGALIQGDLDYAGVLTQLIKEKIDVSKVTKSLFDIDYADFFNIEKNFEFSYK